MQLNLVCSRIDEVLPAISTLLQGMSLPLDNAALPWSQFVQCFDASITAAEITHAARTDSLQAQVRQLSLLRTDECLKDCPTWLSDFGIQSKLGREIFSTMHLC